MVPDGPAQGAGMSTEMSPSWVITDGVGHVLYAYDVGLSIDLNECERLIPSLKQREQVKHKRRAPGAYFDYESPPLRIRQEAAPVAIGPDLTFEFVDFIIHDFGAITVSFDVDLKGPMERLMELSHRLYDNAQLRAASLRQVKRLTTDLRGPSRNRAWRRPWRII